MWRISTAGRNGMMKIPSWPLLSIPVVLAVLGGAAISAQDKYAVQVPGGLSLSECRGYEEWPAVAVSHPEDKINVIVANSVMIEAYRADVPGNGDWSVFVTSTARDQASSPRSAYRPELS
jgi:hypothetical protein